VSFTTNEANLSQNVTADSLLQRTRTFAQRSSSYEDFHVRTAIQNPHGIPMGGIGLIFVVDGEKDIDEFAGRSAVVGNRLNSHVAVSHRVCDR
jgi:hypothetical protein